MQISMSPSMVFMDAVVREERREFFTGSNLLEMEKKMDARKDELVALGHTGFNRVKMGRNAACPCGSGKKFKHCCLAIAK